MSAIPGPPFRPDHVDFWKLSEIVLQQDGKLEDHSLEDIVNEKIDVEVLHYMAIQRALITMEKQRGIDPFTAILVYGDQVTMLMSMWIDGFLAGTTYQERYVKG